MASVCDVVSVGLPVRSLHGAYLGAGVGREGGGGGQSDGGGVLDSTATDER